MTYEERDKILSEIKEKHPDYGRIKLHKETGIPLAAVQRWLVKQSKKGEGTKGAGKVPDGYSVKGVSTCYGPGGEVRQEWVKTDRDKEEMLNGFIEYVQEISEQIAGKSKRQKEPKTVKTDLINVFPLPEPHIGMYSWDEETGSNYDTSKACSVLLETMSSIIQSSPKAETALIINVGDLMHTDNENNKTSASGHDLDVDSRWARVYRMAHDTVIEVIYEALRNHKKVIYKSAKGNHDDKASIALAISLQSLFRKDDRVEIHIPINPFSYHEFGNTLIGINHFNVKSIKELPMIMASDQPEAWGRTKFHHFIGGHKHHDYTEDIFGCIVEMVSTIAPPDYHHNMKGYRHCPSAKSITFHKERGEIGRVTRKIINK